MNKYYVSLVRGHTESFVLLLEISLIA